MTTEFFKNFRSEFLSEKQLTLPIVLNSYEQILNSVICRKKAYPIMGLLWKGQHQPTMMSLINSKMLTPYF